MNYWGIKYFVGIIKWTLVAIPERTVGLISTWLPTCQIINQTNYLRCTTMCLKVVSGTIRSSGKDFWADRTDVIYSAQINVVIKYIMIIILKVFKLTRSYSDCWHTRHQYSNRPTISTHLQTLLGAFHHTYDFHVWPLPLGSFSLREPYWQDQNKFLRRILYCILTQRHIF